MSALDTVTNNDGIIRLERSVYSDARAELAALRAELEQDRQYIAEMEQAL